MTASPGVAPRPVPDHITALSRAGSLSSTHLLFGVLSRFFCFFFPLFFFFFGPLFPPVKTTTSPVKSVPAPHVHRVPDVTAYTPPSLPPASWSFGNTTVSQSLTLNSLAELQLKQRNCFPEEVLLNLKDKRQRDRALVKLTLSCI